MITKFERVLRDARVSSLPDARSAWADFRYRHGFKRAVQPLLTPPRGNSKLAKSSLPTYGLSLSPERESGIAQVNLCPFAGDCADMCLAQQGRSGFKGNPQVRYVRTAFAWEHPDEFARLLLDEVFKAQRRHGMIGLRLNVYSDVQWELFPWLVAVNPSQGIVKYDYTKFPPETRPAVEGYDLTRSFSERVQWAQVVKSLQGGEKWAVVFHGGVPDFYKGIPVVNGDLSDERFLDPPGSLIGLSAKGTAKKSQSPFIVRAARTVHDGKVWAW